MSLCKKLENIANGDNIDKGDDIDNDDDIDKKKVNNQREQNFFEQTLKAKFPQIFTVLSEELENIIN
jgi:hypothetical protein